MESCFLKSRSESWTFRSRHSTMHDARSLRLDTHSLAFEIELFTGERALIIETSSAWSFIVIIFDPKALDIE